jgi:hypothetical protein
MKLNARQVNVLKANIEGNCLESLYNRLKWDTPKTIRLSLEEKDVIQSMVESPYNDEEDTALLRDLVKERLTSKGDN